MLRLVPLIITFTLLINSPFTLLFGSVTDSAYVISLKGDVKIIPAGTKVGFQCYENMSISPGDFINTGSDSQVTIGYSGKTSFVTEIHEDSLVEILDGSPYWLDLSDGKILTSLQGVEDGKTFMVSTPVGACGARGTGWELSTNGLTDKVKVYESKVFYQWLDPYGDMTDIKEAVWIKEGFERAVVKYEKPKEAKTIKQEELSKLQRAGSRLAVYGKLRHGVVERNGIGVNKDGYR